MTTNHILAAAATAALLAMGTTASAQSEFKRGIGVNSYNAEQAELLNPGVSWYYNWSQTTPLATTDGMAYIPMAWRGIDADALRKLCAERPDVKYLLGFNEPNFTSQANLTPAEAAEKWPELRALADELGLKLVAPALNYSSGPYSTPEMWMDEFVALVGLDAFDYTALHCYGGAGLIKSMTESFYEKYGKPIWFTEFNYWPGGAGNVYVAPDVQIASMIESVQFLETDPRIFRYAWFMATGPYDSADRANYGLLKTEGTLTDMTFALTEQGYVYTYMPSFDRTAWQPEGSWFPAAKHVTDAANVKYSTASSTMVDYPLVVSNFASASGWVEYQIEITSTGSKTLDLNLGGYGEPDRFDPTFTITMTHEDGTTVNVVENDQFALANNDNCTMRRSWEFDAPKTGHWTLRIASTGRTSGVKLGGVALYSTTGIGSVEAAEDEDAAVDVYTVQGRLLRRGVSRADATAGLPAGVYLVGDRKVTVR